MLMKKTAALFASFAMAAMLVGCASSGASGNIDEIKAAAAKGDADAMMALGDAYYNGKGVAKDFDEAKKWYDKATSSYAK